MSDWTDVGRVLLGSWPSQVAGWGREAIAAYVGELEARGITPDSAIYAIRSSESKFPPSAGDLQQTARRDPSAPTFDEAYKLVYGRGGVLRARPAHKPLLTDEDYREAQQARLGAVHPTVASFVQRQGIDRLAGLPLDDPRWGEKTRRELREAWDRHVEAFDGRELAALASGRPDGLRQLDPLAALDVGRKELTA